MSAVTRYAWQIMLAVHVLRRGGVIAHPTEAVWGLACDPLEASAVNRLLELKRRPMSKGLILVSGDIDHFEFLLKPLSKDLRDRFQADQTQALTWLLPDDSEQVPVWIKGEHTTVAVRVSRHPVIVALSKQLGRPIISSSANTQGMAPAKTLFKVRQIFENSLSYILPASLGGQSRPSIIRDLKTNCIVRA